MELDFEIFRENRERGEEEEEEHRRSTRRGLVGFAHADRAIGFDVADYRPRVTNGPVSLLARYGPHLVCHLLGFLHADKALSASL